MFSKTKIILIPLASLLPICSFAEVHYDQRTSTYDISTDGTDFTNTTNSYSIYAVMSADAIGDSNTGSLTVKSGYSNLQVTNTGGAVTTIDPVAATSTTSFPTSNLNGTSTISYNTGVTGFGSSFLQKGVSNGLNTLEFQGGGFGFLDNGNSFYLDVNLNGNWTNQGTSTGDIQILGYDPSWSAPKLTYNGTSTNIFLLNTDYNSTTDPNPNLDFKLYGSAAPTPDPAVYLGFGAGFIGLLRLRKRRTI